jgi:hypothetical protein
MLTVGMTGCGKTLYLLNMIGKEYLHVFSYIVIVCPTIKINKTYQEWKYLTTDKNIIKIPCKQESVDLTLKLVSDTFSNTNTLVVIDDCAASRCVKNKVSELVRLDFSA